MGSAVDGQKNLNYGILIFGKHRCHVTQTEEWDDSACYQHSVQKPASLMVLV